MAYYDNDNRLIWVQRDGTEIPMVDMETSHLTFTIEMLRRNAEKHLEAAGLDPREVYRIFPYYTDLCAELERRLNKQREDEEHPAVTRMRNLEWN